MTLSANAPSQTQKDRAAGRAAAWIGGALLALALIMGALETGLAGGCARQNATIIFELGGFDATRTLLTGPCGHERVAAMIWVSWIDIALFIPLCAVFMVWAARVVSGRWFGPLVFIVAGLMLAASLNDWAETFTELHILDWVAHHRGWDFAEMRDAVEFQLYAARAKFVLHCAALGLMALRLMTRKIDPWRVTAVLLAAPAFGASAAAHDAEANSIFLLAGFAIAWIALIVMGVRVARAPEPPPSDAKPTERWQPWRNPSETPPEPL